MDKGRRKPCYIAVYNQSPRKAGGIPMKTIVALTVFVLGASLAQAAEPVKIGITTILSGPMADRGQQEQYGAQLALDRINQAGGVLGRPVEAFYADNACKPDIGVPATKRLLDEVHVPVIIGALCTPVTHAIMPVMQAAKVPLVIATSAGQDFVDASGAGGNDFAFKTIPSEVDIMRGLAHWLKSKDVKSIAVIADDGEFQHANAIAIVKAAKDAGINVTADETIPKDSKDLAPILDKVKGGSPAQLVAILGPSTAGFFKAYEASGWKVPVTGRFDLAGAQGAVSQAFRDAGGLADLTGIAVFTPALDKPEVQDFVAAYKAHYGIMPTQRSFFVFEATYLVVDAIKRAGSDKAEAIQQALKTTAMPSRLGGAYKLDDHNHPRTPLQVIGLHDGKPAVIAIE
jgi:branched-chain amino acid transport system substrate-binding protein